MGPEAKKKLTTNSADRGGGVGETHILKPGVGVVSVNAGWIHQFWGLAVFEGEMLEGGLHCRLQVRDWSYEGGRVRVEGRIDGCRDDAWTRDNKKKRKRKEKEEEEREEEEEEEEEEGTAREEIGWAKGKVIYTEW